MPYWSIAEWRAHIGSSWCALGRPVKSKSSYRRGSGWVQRVLTLNQVVTMMIMMIMLIGVNHTLCATVSGGYCLPLTNLLPGGAVSPILYLLQSGYLLYLALWNCAPLLYQLFPILLKRSLQQFCCDLMQSFYFSAYVFHHLLFLISLLVYIILWVILYVTLKLDWLRAVSSLKKLLTNGKTKSKIVKEVEFGKRSEILRWLARAKSLLDTVLSATASVINSLLLMSGDIEENPGPGDLDYNDVDASRILDKDDLIDVKEEVLLIQSLYYPLGQALRLDTTDLRRIRDAYPSESDTEQALEDVLLLWLDKKYNTKKFGAPTWRKLVEAVDRKGGGNNRQLAKEIASKHPTVGFKPLVPAAASVTSSHDECTLRNDTPVTKEKSTNSLEGAEKTPKPVANIKEEELLGIGDMREVQDLFWDIRAKWRNIGLGLGIDVGTLDSIEKTNRMVVEDCLFALLTRWLQHNNPKPTRSALNEVLCSKPLTSVSSSGKGHINCAVYAQYLKSLYKVKTLASSSDDDQWPPPVTEKIFRLAMIKTEEQVRRKYQRENSEDDFVREKTITGKVDDLLQRKVPIQLEEVFKDIERQRKSVLMEGAPGSGKSTLSIHICHQWTEGTLFQEYRLVILVRLRESSIQNATRIAELLPRCNESMGSDAEEEITNIYGRSVLFVLDGWDELPQEAPAYSMILKLIKGEQLPESSIIITSRPTASAILHALVSLRTEILGFTKDELHRYFEKCLENSQQAAENLLQRIRQNPTLEGNCYLPLNASILVHLFKCQGNVLPTTQYGIFTELVRSCIYRHLNKTQHQDISELKSWDDLPFQKLCKLAYDGIMEDRVVFDLSSDFNTLGLLQGVESFAVRGKSYSFNFLHLTIQELLAATYMATKLEEKEQTEQFNKLFGKLRFAAVFQFFAAKTKLRTSGISDIVKQVATSGQNALLVSLIYCLFEAQDSSLCELVAGELKQKLYLGGTSLTPADCYCLGYFLTYCKDFEVTLQQCTIANEHCKCLFRQGEVYNLRYLK